MVVSMKMAIFWVVALCSMVEVYHHFRGPCGLCHLGSGCVVPYNLVEVYQCFRGSCCLLYQGNRC
jgi:hypothetical protein